MSRDNCKHGTSSMAAWSKYIKRLGLAGVLFLGTTHASAQVQNETVSNVSKNVHAVSTEARLEKDCSANDWYTFSYGRYTEIVHNFFNSAKEIALLDGGNPVTFGTYRDQNGLVQFRECELDHSADIIRVPVFLIDWDDFDPKVDQSNPNNPESIEGPDYQRQSANTIREYLNGDGSVANYFRDVSGGRLNIEFVVYDWFESGASGSHLRQHQQYLYQAGDEGRWYCRRDLVMQDALKEAILNWDMSPTEFDVNHGKRGHTEGFFNGAVLIYEGGAGLCSGTNMSHMGISSFDPGALREEAGIELFKISDLQVDDPSDQSVLDALDINLRVYNNLPESSVYDNHLFTWAHEIGHMFLGFKDYYYPKYNVGTYALSSSSYGKQPIQPAGIEKWLFGKWIEPTVLQESGIYSITSHDIGDGEDYLNDEVYLYKIPLGNDADRFLIIENRWLNDAGNTASSWVSNYIGDFMPSSGLQIFDVNLREDNFSANPTIYRVTPSESAADSLNGWQKGMVFTKCLVSKCIRISDISDNSKEMTFKLDVFVDSDGDGISDQEDDFPEDPEEWLDTDNDGIGNNADLDDDNDTVPDDQDAFPLDPNESVDTDNDGIGNNADLDDDNDNVSDEQDAFPLDPNESVDTDNDGIGNNADLDDDNDAVPDEQDAFPLDATRSQRPASHNETGESAGGGSAGVLLILLLCALLFRKAELLR